MVKMKAFKLLAVSLLSFLPSMICLIAFSTPALAQREYTVVRPRERSSSESVTIRTKAALPSRGVLAIVLDPVVNGQVVVKDSTGRVISTLEADKDGQAEVQLARNKIYQVEATYPGFLSVTGKSRPLKASEVMRLKLVPQFAKLVLSGLPASAQVQIDGQSKVTANQFGVATVNELNPGDHSIKVLHPEYNDYANSLKGLEAGALYNWQISMIRVAKLKIQGPAGATVMIDGAVQGKIQNDGTVRIDYELQQAAEKTISVELLGYKSWSETKKLAPGPYEFEVKLDPIVTSTGVTDGFDSLSQWQAPSTWELVTEGRNKKLRVKGSQLGLLKDKIYRDIHEDSNFTIWLEDGKGASWAVKADKEGRSYYLFHLAGPKSTGKFTPNNFYTFVVTNGAEPVEASTPFPVLTELDQKASYLINIEISGDKIMHWITSNKTGEKEAMTGPQLRKKKGENGDEKTPPPDLGVWTNTSVTKDKFLFGTFGFRSLTGEVFSVDDFILEPKKEQ